MVVVGCVDRLARLVGDNCRAKRAGVIEPADIGLGDLWLLVICREDRRTVIPSDIGALSFELVGSCGTEK